MLKLYVIATPIGNLDDITFRAVKILNSVDTILCEDTRITSRLLQKYQISDKKLLVYNDHSSDIDRQNILKLIQEGAELALVSDAGTPNISDPGQSLVKYLTLNNVRIVPVPGCSSIIAAVSSSSLDIDKFLFIGFFPIGKQKASDLITKIDRDFSFIYLERSSRLLSSLDVIKSVLGSRNITIARELTKIHEQIINDSIDNIIEYFTNNPNKLKGEFVVIVEKSTDKEALNIEEVKLNIEKLLEKGLKTKEISEVLSLKHQVNKKIIYDLILQLKK